MSGLIRGRAKVRPTGRYDNISFIIKTTFYLFKIYKHRREVMKIDKHYCNFMKKFRIFMDSHELVLIQCIM